ncbi:putative carbohydrate esterase family 15 protein [Rosellinia necatrix]|uniref:Putative carbohydrate esterase family 15 protein n=1 Tax=Rosellinia necatrix TaxID=77044 RepID=A0A1S8A731_ROSNE|nr:putative carbohydrate esterase family 15 protein [Rosellinia necatrix]
MAMPACRYGWLLMPPMLMTAGAGLDADAPDGSASVALNRPVLPPAVTSMLTVVPLRVALTVSWLWSG